MELTERSQRCYIVSWRSISQTAAALLSALVSAAITSWLPPEELLAGEVQRLASPGCNPTARLENIIAHAVL